MVNLLGISSLCFTQVNQLWVRRYEGQGINAPDQSLSITVDVSGNVYVTGSSEGIGIGLNFATIKYNNNGSKLWVARYDGTANGEDVATALAVDGSGNVYVTGRSAGSGTGDDYATIKYDANGNELWAVRFDGLVSGNDRPTAIALDDLGNVYVTGESTIILDEDLDGTDMVTIKYNASGVQQWVARYSNRFLDHASGLILDESGNVYITGWTGSDDDRDDYATIKYNATGVQLWATIYNGPGDGNDRANALMLDASGNIYVTGSSASLPADQDWAFATVKYNSLGVQQWVSRYNGPGNFTDIANSLGVDEGGNVYVTGYSIGNSTGLDFATIKYNTAGGQQWVERYDGPGAAALINFNNKVSLALDNKANVYITGYRTASGSGNDFATIKYDKNGNRKWTKKYNGPGNGEDIANAVAVDENGRVYITGRSLGDGTGDDYATVKYGKDGDTRWVTRFNGSGSGEDRATAIANDDDGNVYVTGYSQNNGSGLDYTTIKYNKNGTQQWIKTYNGPGNGADLANAIAVDEDGNVYVTGESEGSGTYLDYATIKYDKNGNQKWVKRYDGPGNTTDRAYAIAVDEDGKVYVTGLSYGTTSMTDYATIKYNKDGDTKWVRRYNGPGNGFDGANSLAVDAHGNVIVTGYSRGSGTEDDYATIKYDNDGDVKWVARYNGPADRSDGASSLVVDPSGNVYVTGQSFEIENGSAYATVKYNTTGVQQWVQRYHPGIGSDNAYALAVDATGNVFVTGASTLDDRYDEGYDYATIKYNAAGDELWVQKYNGPDNLQDKAYALALDASGNVYVTGFSNGIGTSDYATIKYNTDGVQQWVERYNGPANAVDIVAAIVVDEDDNVYVTGFSEGIGTGPDYATLKYAQSSPPVLPAITSATNLSKKDLAVYDRFWISHAPNPVVNTARIQYNLPIDGQVSIKVFDIQGRELKTLVNVTTKAGFYSTGFEASSLQGGMYYYRLALKSEKKWQVQTKKMLVVK